MFHQSWNFWKPNLQNRQAKKILRPARTRSGQVEWCRHARSSGSSIHWNVVVPREITWNRCLKILQKLATRQLPKKITKIKRLPVLPAVFTITLPEYRGFTAGLTWADGAKRIRRHRLSQPIPATNQVFQVENMSENGSHSLAVARFCFVGMNNIEISQGSTRLPTPNSTCVSETHKENHQGMGCICHSSDPLAIQLSRIAALRLEYSRAQADLGRRICPTWPMTWALRPGQPWDAKLTSHQAIIVHDTRDGWHHLKWRPLCTVETQRSISCSSAVFENILADFLPHFWGWESLNGKSRTCETLWFPAGTKPRSTWVNSKSTWAEQNPSFPSLAPHLMPPVSP